MKIGWQYLPSTTEKSSNTTDSQPSTQQSSINSAIWCVPTTSNLDMVRTNNIKSRYGAYKQHQIQIWCVPTTSNLDFDKTVKNVDQSFFFYQSTFYSRRKNWTDSWDLVTKQTTLDTLWTITWRGTSGPCLGQCRPVLIIVLMDWSHLSKTRYVKKK